MKKFFIIVFVLFVCILGGKNINAESAFQPLDQETFEARLDTLEQMADLFRADEKFMYDINSGLTVVEKKELQELLRIDWNVMSLSTSALKLDSIQRQLKNAVQYKKDKNNEYRSLYTILFDSGDQEKCELNEKEYADTLYMLCALADIPVFRLEYSEGYGDTFQEYEIVMVYLDGEYRYVDAWQQKIMTKAELYDETSEYFCPEVMTFRYKAVKGLLSYNGEISLTRGRGSGDLYFDTSINKVVVNDYPKTYFNHLYDEKIGEHSEAPNGFVHVQLEEKKDGKYYNNSFESYSQYGILATGEVEIDGVVHNYTANTTFQSVFETVESHITTAEEIAALNQFKKDNLKRTVQIAEAMLAEKDYQYFFDTTPEETAFIQEIVDEVTSLEWMKERELTFKGRGITLPDRQEDVTDYMKAVAIEVYIVNNIEYEYLVLHTPTSYEALRDKYGTCSDFSDLFRDMCYLADIPSFSLMASNTTNNKLEAVNHAANIVKCDGKWYWLDPTNNSAIRTMDDMLGYKTIYAFSLGEHDNGMYVYISHEMQLYERYTGAHNADYCYEFDEDGKLELYYMTRVGAMSELPYGFTPIDENGKCAARNGWYEHVIKETTDTGYQRWKYRIYFAEGHPVFGKQTIDGVTYDFVREQPGISISLLYCSGYKAELVEDITYINSKYMTVSGVEKSYTYTGSPIEPKPVIEFRGKTLVEGTDYTLSYDNNTVVQQPGYGDARVIITGKGKYESGFPIVFKIDPIVVSDKNVIIDTTPIVYSKEADKNVSYPTPDITIKLPQYQYTTSITGAATNLSTKKMIVTVTGKYNCTGSVTKEIDLLPISIASKEFKVKPIPDQVHTKDGQEHKPEVELVWLNEDGSEYKTLYKSDYTITYENNTEVGEAKAIITATDIYGCFTGKIETAFQIVKGEEKEEEEKEDYGQPCMDSRGHYFPPEKCVTIQKVKCGQQGIAKKKCAYCDLEVEERTEPGTHKFPSGWQNHITVSCMKDGEEIRCCNLCGYTESRVVPSPMEHDYEYLECNSYKVSCSTNGLNVYQCKKCQYTKYETITAPGHKWLPPVTVPPTEDKDGTITKTCEVCGYSSWESIDRLPKKEPSEDDIIPPTVIDNEVPKDKDNSGQSQEKDNTGGGASHNSSASKANITISKKETKIADNAFKGNTKVIKITVGKNVKKIGKNVFKGCTKLKTIIILSTKLTSKSVAKNAFKGVTKKTVIKVPKSKFSAYKKLFRKKGLSKKVKIKIGRK